MHLFEESMEPAYFYFAEQTSPDASDNPINPVVNKGPNGTWWVEFDTCLHLFEFMNRNVRQYLGDNIMECLQLEKIASQLRNNGLYGEADHPYASIDGQKLSEKRIKTIEMERISHNISNLRREGNRLNAHIKTDPESKFGKAMAGRIIQGLIPSFSCRCFGVMRLINGKPTIIVRIIITYDWVLYPGFEDAKMTNAPTITGGTLPPTAKIGAGNPLFESVDVEIPLGEIAIDLSQKDDNIKAYMEAFDTDASAIVGFDNDRAIIAPDNDHYIYTKMNKNSIDMVRDFYRSFRK